MSSRIVFYQLHKKFVNQREDIPENAKQVIYYTLAVGHHVGVMDCFSALFEVPLDEFRQWLQSLPEGPGRSKLDGVIEWGEIEVNRSHVEILMPMLAAEAHKFAWIPTLIQCLKGMLQEPALYLMVRKYG
jgi:hydrogenase-4 component J